MTFPQTNANPFFIANEVHFADVFCFSIQDLWRCLSAKTASLQWSTTTVTSLWRQEDKPSTNIWEASDSRFKEDLFRSLSPFLFNCLFLSLTHSHAHIIDTHSHTLSHTHLHTHTLTHTFKYKIPKLAELWYIKNNNSYWANHFLNIFLSLGSQKRDWSGNDDWPRWRLRSNRGWLRIGRRYNSIECRNDGN